MPREVSRALSFRETVQMLGDRTGEVLVSSISPSAWALALKETQAQLMRTGSRLGEGFMAVPSKLNELGTQGAMAVGKGVLEP